MTTPWVCSLPADSPRLISPSVYFFNNRTVSFITFVNRCLGWEKLLFSIPFCSGRQWHPVDSGGGGRVVWAVNTRGWLLVLPSPGSQHPCQLNEAQPKGLPGCCKNQNCVPSPVTLLRAVVLLSSPPAGTQVSVSRSGGDGGALLITWPSTHQGLEKQCLRSVLPSQA